VINSNFEKKILFETDWLASEPIFYNLKKKTASKKFCDLIENHENIEFHPEGLKNFLDFGYSVFEQTPLKDIKFLPPASRLSQHNNENLVVEKLDDPVDKWLDYKISEVDIIDLIKERVQNWEKSLPPEKEIFLPLSGGYDSRLLLWCINDKSRIKAYTYGVSHNQEKSYDVVFAKYLANYFNLNWQQVELGKFHNFFNDWHKEFGLSTHAHGMYHFEFYKQIKKKLENENFFLSGIFGDVWAGSTIPVRIKTPKDIIKLGYSHDIIANSNFLKLKSDNKNLEKFFFNNKEKLSDYRFQVITTIRLKIILISYLMRVPRLFNFKSWTPFLDIDIAMAMLNLPQKRRNNRQWQTDFFKKIDLDIENKNIKFFKNNSLDFQAMRNQMLQPLDVESLSKIIDSNYIKWINKNCALTIFNKLWLKIITIPKVIGIMKLFGISDNTYKAYCAYLCLKPLEKYLKKK
jgi:hypothetical protein